MKVFYTILVIWLASCSEKSARKGDSDNLLNKFESFDSTTANIKIDRDNSWAPFHSKYSFTTFPAKVYPGKLTRPDFTSVEYGNDQGFQEFMQERLKGMPINFAGKYSIVEKSCGAMCLAIYMVDRITGKIFVFPPEGDGKWGYKYHPDSHLLVGNSELLNDSTKMYLNQWVEEPEFYRWTGKKSERLR